MIVLGIETSCDETSVSIVQENKDGGKVLSEKVLSQVKKHQPFGGVVPELASREHSDCISNLTRQVLSETNLNLDDVDAFAATTGPGLLGGLLVGCNYAKGLSIINNKPFLSINHLQGHILVSRMYKKINFPFLCLLVSGGHSLILLVENFNKFKILGQSIDDAVGEAFDKTAKLLGLGYPGGPLIEKLAKKALGKKEFNLPRPLINHKTMNLSFSGLKTSVRRIIENNISQSEKADLAYEFQKSITECLLKKVMLAIESSKNYKIKDFVLSGGVASNFFIRNQFRVLCVKKNINFVVPAKSLCTDNATMIAWAGIEKLRNQKRGDSLDIHPKPRWSLESI
jgi:N6-L-threonylcarbamoyladenine synthase